MVEGFLKEGLKEEVEGRGKVVGTEEEEGLEEDMREYLSGSGLLWPGMCMRGVLGIVGEVGGGGGYICGDGVVLKRKHG